jgi:hypothetical protein
LVPHPANISGLVFHLAPASFAACTISHVDRAGVVDRPICAQQWLGSKPALL